MPARDDVAKNPVVIGFCPAHDKPGQELRRMLTPSQTAAHLPEHNPCVRSSRLDERQPTHRSATNDTFKDSPDYPRCVLLSCIVVSCKRSQCAISNPFSWRNSKSRMGSTNRQPPYTCYAAGWKC